MSDVEDRRQARWLWHSSMTAMRIALFALLPASTQCWAETMRGVPEKLFGITLGATYDLGDPEKKDFGTMPVKKVTGVNGGMSHGIHYYFQPKEAHEFFKYIEKRTKPNDRYFETSFRAYLLPVIPATVTSLEQLKKEKLKWEVGVIEWSNEPKKKEDAYYWAISLCKTFAADISVTPEIFDHYEEKIYECKFFAGDREFKVSSFYSRSVQLGFRREVSEKKHELLENVLRKLQAKEIRPY